MTPDPTDHTDQAPVTPVAGRTARPLPAPADAVVAAAAVHAVRPGRQEATR
ncbi:hypothetical protein ABZO31_27250 [Streptomyces sp. HUAS MG47]|uniref:hypothetical protein n=1 Tax=Streptomyces solicamelliae TaxID=3231716 RepID=UPI003877B315